MQTNGPETLKAILARYFGTPEVVRRIERQDRRAAVKRRQLELEFKDDEEPDGEDRGCGCCCHR